MRMSAQERVKASGKEPAREQAVLEPEQAAQALTYIRRYPMAQRVDSRLQLPEVPKAPLGGTT